MADLYFGQIKDIVLGQDFLTWLWYASEKNEWRFTASNGEEYLLLVEQQVSVQGGEGEAVEKAVVSGASGQLREARLGLASGKKVTKAKIRVELEVEAFQFTFKADDFTHAGFKTPPVETKDREEDPDGVFLEKMYLMERCMGYMDELFATFINLRLGPSWPEEAKAVGAWLRNES